MRITKIGKNAYKRFVDSEMKDFFIDFFGKSVGSDYYKTYSFKEKKFLFAAKEKGKTIGVILLRVGHRVASIGAFAVTKGYRKKGVGSKLLEKCEAVARKNRCKKIWLWTVPAMPAYKFYKENGYKEEARLKKHFGGRDLCVLSKFF
ncbi:MAG: GNAT family N-acetyltransferase [Candidatus Micrarchaeota archaeon]